MKRAILATTILLLFSGATARAQPATPVIDPSSFSTNVTNPYFPLPLGAVRIYAGWERDPETGEVHQNRVEETVLTEPDEVMGVPVVVLQVMEYQDGNLVEETRDYHAQHADGSVWYFGEEVDKIENGQVVNHDGSWLAGDRDNQPSLFMPADPQVLDTIQQEQAPGLAEDFSTVAQTGVPGPVFVEVPVDLLYPEENVRQFYGAKAAADTKSLPELALQGYLRLHLARVFAGANKHVPRSRIRVEAPRPFPGTVDRAAKLLREAERPVLLLGSQATLQPEELPRLVKAIETLGVPVYLSGMARGLLGASHPLWFRHNRGKALKEADLVILAGVPCDFRLDYGLQISRKAKLIAVNRSEADAKKNRRPTLAVTAGPAGLVCALAEHVRPAARATPDSDAPARAAWAARLRARDDEREEQIAEQMAEQMKAKESPEPAMETMSPLAVVRAIDDALADDSVQVADGGDFVATASYVTRPRSPLSWLDPGVFGTLGVGAGFALGAKLCRPDAEVWVIYGDGSVGYSIAEFDTFVRHGLPVIAVVGNDASWQQIARDQITLLGDDVGTVLARSDYHRVVEGFGAKGLVVDRVEDLPRVLAEAKAAAAAGTPVLINAHIGKSEFRKGSISM